MSVFISSRCARLLREMDVFIPYDRIYAPISPKIEGDISTCRAREPVAGARASHVDIACQLCIDKPKLVCYTSCRVVVMRSSDVASPRNQTADDYYIPNGESVVKEIDEIYRTEGYAAAKAEADRRNVIWFASAGAKRK